MTQNPSYYRLRVNINGFRLEDIKVSLIVDKKEITNNTKQEANDKVQKCKVQVRISATRKHILSDEESSKEYVKYYDILTKSNVDINTMRYYLDPKNSLFLIVEFVSNTNENVYVNLDDSCESLVEMAAKSLINIKNIEDLRSCIENPFDTSYDKNLEDILSPSIIKDLSNSAKTTFTPTKIIENPDGSKLVRVDLSIPYSVKTVSLLNKNSNSQIANINSNEESNHLTIKIDGLKLNFDAITTNENTTSTFSKQFSLPKGTKTSNIKYKFDENKHSIILEAPYSI